MTYRDLIKKLRDLKPYQLDMDVTVWDGTLDEFYAIEGDVIGISSEDDVLDKGHPYLPFGLKSKE